MSAGSTAGAAAEPKGAATAAAAATKATTRRVKYRHSRPKVCDRTVDLVGVTRDLPCQRLLLGQQKVQDGKGQVCRRRRWVRHWCQVVRRIEQHGVAGQSQQPPRPQLAVHEHLHGTRVRGRGLECFCFRLEEQGAGRDSGETSSSRKPGTKSGRTPHRAVFSLLARLPSPPPAAITHNGVVTTNSGYEQGSGVWHVKWGRSPLHSTMIRAVDF